MKNTNTNNFPNLSSVLRSLFGDEADVFNSIQKKAEWLKKTGRPAFRTKKYDRENYILDVKKACILDRIFSLEMYEIEKDFSDTREENIKAHVLEGTENPQLKMKKVYLLNDLLFEALEMYEEEKFSKDKGEKEVMFFFMYSVFLAMLDELKGTSKENRISEYNALFEAIFSVM